MNLNLHIPQPLFWIVATVLAIVILKLVASWIYPSN